MHRELICTKRFSKKEAQDLLANINPDDFKNSSLWASQMVSRRVDTANVLKNVASSMHACNYDLAVGTLELSPLGSAKATTHAVFFWIPKENDTDFADDTIEYNIDYPVVDADRPYDLIQQAYMIRKAYQNGVDARTREVRSHVAGIMGVSDDRMGQVFGLTDEDL